MNTTEQRRKFRRWLTAAAVAGTLLGSAGIAAAATGGNSADTNPAATATAATAPVAGFTFKSNENAAHEAAETPEQEAA